MSSLICCVKGNGDGRGRRGQVPTGDYLLPGGEWGPSNSSSPSRIATPRGGGSSPYHTDSSGSRGSRNRFTSFLSRRFGSRRSEHFKGPEESAGNYQPPPLLPTRTLPTYDDFKLLKTVGRGAFGKVRRCS